MPAVARGVEEEERRAVNPAVMMNDTLFNDSMTGWIVTTEIVLLLPIWPPAIAARRARSTGCIEPITESGSVYPFQREGGGNG